MKNIVKKYTKEIDLTSNGIYKIQSKDKKYVYVGSTKCKGGFYKRWYAHINQLKNNKHSSPKLQNIINKHGLDYIEFIIIEKLTIFENLYKREQFWLDYYKESTSIIINFAPIVAANTLSMTLEIKNKISKSLKGKYIGKFSSNSKIIHKYSVNGEFIKTYDCILDIANELGSYNSNFRNINKPIFYRGFIFSRTFLNPLQIEYFKKYGVRKKYWCRKPIDQFDKDDNFIKEWACAEDIAEYFKTTTSSINQALNGKVKLYKKFKWKYSKYQNPWDSN